jgi:hypothetical protein
MYPSLNDKRNAKHPAFAGPLLAALGLWAGVVGGACTLVDLRPLSVRPEPEAADTVLAEARSSVALHFDGPVEKAEAEQACAVLAERGAVEGDYYWRDNSLWFTPRLPWISDQRYTLSLSGLIHSLDGRELEAALSIPFYGTKRPPSPRLISASPQDGAAVGISAEEGSVLEFEFSLPMDRPSTEKALIVQGFGSLEFTWDDGDRKLTVLPAEVPQPWQTIHWTLDQGAQSREGTPLEKRESGFFSTDKDRTPPQVARTFVLVKSGTSWVDTGNPLGNIEEGMAVGVDFSEPMDQASMSAALRIEPYLRGRTEIAGSRRILFIPEQTFARQTTYTLRVRQEAKDASSLAMAEEYRERFTPVLPFLRCASIRADGCPPFVPSEESGLDAGGAAPIAYAVAPIPPEGLLALTLRFSAPLDAPSLADAASRIRLDPFFPGTLGPVGLRSVTSVSSDSLRFLWEGLTRGSAEIIPYYTLTIPGGPAGIQDGKGLRMAQDLVLRIEALP